MLGTRSFHALSEAIINLLNQILLPIFCTKLMAALQTISLSRPLIKLGVTNAAKTLVIRSQSSIDVWEVFCDRWIEVYTYLVL
jgi:hypothetical protein